MAESNWPEGLPRPAQRALESGGYTQLEQLDGVSAAELLKLHGMGPKGIRILREALTGRGMAFAGERQKITTFLMFEGRAEEAMTFYTSLFDDGEILRIERYGPEGPGPEGSVVQATFSLAGQTFMAIDSWVSHEFTFTPAISLYVHCESVEEIDRLYGALSEDGAVMMELGEYPFSERFGWVADRFGVTWQLTV